MVSLGIKMSRLPVRYLCRASGSVAKESLPNIIPYFFLYFFSPSLYVSTQNLVGAIIDETPVRAVPNGLVRC